ncbi:MAG: hypothetical protein Q4F99_04005 [bacterium]|nr:hypothetical protein [bacterium]
MLRRTLASLFCCCCGALLMAQIEASIEAKAPAATHTVVTKCKLTCAPENEAYTLSLIRSPSLRMEVAKLYANQFPLQENLAQHTDWASRLAMPGVVTFDAETKIVTFTVAAETEEEALQINHTYVDLCRRTLQAQTQAYVERATKTITASIRAEIDAENKRLQTLLDAPYSTRIKLQREDSIYRLKTLNQQLQQAEAIVRQQAASLEVLP